jgi:hypothetical protein
VINGNNNTIINNGVPVERVTAATKSDIQKVALRDMSGASTRGGRRERLESDGRTLAVHRPQAPQNSLTPASGRTGGSRQESGGARSRPALTQTDPPAVSRTEKQLDQSPATPSRLQGQRPAPTAPTSERTGLVVESPVSRPAATAPQPRESVAAQGSSVATTKTEPRAKPIDVPASRPVARPPTAKPAENSAAVAGRSSERSGAVAPLIVRGTERVNEPVAPSPAPPQVTAPSPREPSRPSSSVVVIGRRNGSSPQTESAAPVARPTSRPIESPRPETPSSSVNAASERPAFSRPSATQREFSQPSSAPTVTRSAPPESRSRPDFSAPASRPSAPAPAPNVTPRPAAPSPAPQISRPVAPAPAPAARPQPSPPAVSAPRPEPAPAARPSPSSASSNSRPSNRNN